MRLRKSIGRREVARNGSYKGTRTPVSSINVPTVESERKPFSLSKIGIKYLLRKRS